jgi:hypothetical protein
MLTIERATAPTEEVAALVAALAAEPASRRHR